MKQHEASPKKYFVCGGREALVAVIWTAPADVCGLRGLRVARGASEELLTV